MNNCVKICFFIIPLSFSFCKTKTEKKSDTSIKTKNSIKYAKGFDIVIENNQKKLIIKTPYQNAKKNYTYILGNETDLSKNKIKVPLKNIVTTSTTHIPMLELIGVESSIIGFPNTNFISSKKTRQRIKNKKITELGIGQEMNLEILVNLSPELVIGSALNGNNKSYANIQKMEIPVIYNGDWLEETPLGRAEWIKFFGVLYDEEKKADSIFNAIENEYLKIKEIAKETLIKPTILSGSIFQETWNLPAGKSFMATFFNDANLDYLWKNTKGKGSLQLSIESVLYKAHNADFWIACGLFETKNQLLSTNKHYKNIKALKNNTVYTIASKKGETGGLIYFENAPVRPDLVLKDLIKITNPTLLPNYTLTFFERMQ